MHSKKMNGLFFLLIRPVPILLLKPRLLKLTYVPQDIAFLTMSWGKNYFRDQIKNFSILLKEVFQPHLPVRLPCYDFTLVTSPALGVPLLLQNLSFVEGWGNDFGHSQLPWCDGRCVQGPGTYSPQYGWPAITSDSAFMQASCSLQSELRPGFWGWLALAGLHLFVPAIVARVSPRT